MGGPVHADLDTLATALYVRIDEALKTTPQLNRARPRVGITPRLTDAELLTLAVLQGLLGYHSEARWLRYARTSLVHLFPYLPGQSGYNKRLRAAVPQLIGVLRLLATETGLWRDQLRLADSTPVECGRSRQTVTRSALAGWAGYGYCPSHSRRFWGLRLHLVTTCHGLPVAFALANPKLDEREILLDLVELDPGLLAPPGGVVLLADKGYRDQATEHLLAEHGITLVRPAFRNEQPRPGRLLLKLLRQVIESVNQTLKGQLDLEQHGGRTSDGVAARITQRLLALTAAIWHNCHTGQPVLRSLIAYDH
jgi:Transposase DDE domain